MSERVVELPSQHRTAPPPEFERTPPQDVAAEQSVLGGMLLSKDAIADVVEVVRATDFYKPAHQTIFDVVVDIREGSPTRGRHFALVLSAEAGNELYVPTGFAHGFQTLEDDTEVAYQISSPYSGPHTRGFRYDSPALAIPWPEAVTVISDRDRELPPFPADPAAAGAG